MQLCWASGHNIFCRKQWEKYSCNFFTLQSSLLECSSSLIGNRTRLPFSLLLRCTLLSSLTSMVLMFSEICSSFLSLTFLTLSLLDYLPYIFILIFRSIWLILFCEWPFWFQCHQITTETVKYTSSHGLLLSVGWTH